MQMISGKGGVYSGRQVTLLTWHGKERVIAAAQLIRKTGNPWQTPSWIG